MHASRATSPFTTELFAVSRAILLGLMVVIGAGVAGCHQRPLPQADSDDAHVYIDRCGQCHAPYDPRSMTAAMWQTQLDLMEPKIRQAGLPALTEAQRRAILDYLTRNAGKR